MADRDTVESGYKVYVCPRGNLLYCRPYFINDPTVKSHMRVAYWRVSLILYQMCSLPFVWDTFSEFQWPILLPSPNPEVYLRQSSLAAAILDMVLFCFLKLSYALINSCFCWIVKFFLVGVSGVFGVPGVLGGGNSFLRFGVQSRSSPGRFRGVPSIMMHCRNTLFNFPRVTSLSTACKQTKLDANRSAVCKMTHVFHQGSHFRVNSDVLTLRIYFINGFIYFIPSRILL